MPKNATELLHALLDFAEDKQLIETEDREYTLNRLLVDAVTQRDYPVIQGLVLLFSLEFILINLIVDVLYGVINPSIRYK